MTSADIYKIGVASLLTVSYLAYSVFLYSTLPIPKNSTSIAAQQGKLVWQKYNCNACHQVYGQGGYIGPDLTNVCANRSELFIKTFLKYGTPTMPNFNLTEQEIGQIVAFLKNVDASGSADPRTFKTYIDGTIKQ